MKSFKLAALLMAGTLLSSTASAEMKENLIGKDKAINTSISIYNNNLAFVKDMRNVNLNKGDNLVAFEGVASQMRPETVRIAAPEIIVTEQNYDYNLLNQQNIMQEYVGKTVKTAVYNQETGQSTYSNAKVISSNFGQPVLEFDYGIETNFPGRVIFDEIPEKLRRDPTFVATIKSANAKEKQIEMAYLTGGVSWKADYIADITDENILNLNGWITLNNDSGTDYENANVQLIAGNVNMESFIATKIVRGFGVKNMAVESVAMDMAGAEMPVQEPMGDYHLYTLPEATTIKDKQSKQVNLLSQNNVKFEKKYQLSSPSYIGFGIQKNEFKKANPDVMIKIVNVKKDNLGTPLPQGIVRFYDKDSKNQSQFMGESRIAQLAVGEKAELRLGKAFDIFAEGKIKSARRISEKVYETDAEVIINNAKDKEIEVEYMQNFGDNWEILSESIKSEKENSGTAKWIVKIPAGGKLTITYKVRINR